MFDGLTDEEDVGDKQLYGDESLEIDIAGAFEIQAKNDSGSAPNMECIENIRHWKRHCTINRTPHFGQTKIDRIFLTTDFDFDFVGHIYYYYYF